MHLTVLLEGHVLLFSALANPENTLVFLTLSQKETSLLLNQTKAACSQVGHGGKILLWDAGWA